MMMIIIIVITSSNDDSRVDQHIQNQGSNISDKNVTGYGLNGTGSTPGFSSKFFLRHYI
jgi:hypothetical protein